jgi:hypothetical protein
MVHLARAQAGITFTNIRMSAYGTYHEMQPLLHVANCNLCGRRKGLSLLVKEVIRVGKSVA